MTNGRATLQIYGEVATRTRQRQNPDGASRVKGRRGWLSQYQRARIFVLWEMHKKYERGACSIRPECVGSALAKARDLEGGRENTLSIDQRFP